MRVITTKPERLFVVGDIHGCRLELAALLGFIRRKRGFNARDLLVFVGDYVDRGPDSRGVVQDLIDLRKEFPDNTVFLKGNHEDMFMAFLGFRGNMGGSYTYNGGLQTLHDYGINEFCLPEECRAAIPEEHMQFYQGLERLVVVDNYVFVHAGVNPLRSLEAQLEEDLYWIRDEFIQNYHYFDKTIVFGHTPYRDVLFNLPYKIGLDTGAVYGNMLSCVELSKGEVFQVDRGENEVKVSTFADKGAGSAPGLAAALDGD